jgi:hypothetical protein
MANKPDVGCACPLAKSNLNHDGLAANQREKREYDS